MSVAFLTNRMCRKLLNGCKTITRPAKSLGEASFILMMLLLLLPILINPPLMAATYPFVVIHPPTQAGSLVTVEGYAGFHCPPGKPDQYHVQVSWEHGGEVVFVNNLAEIPPLKEMGGGNYEYNFFDNQTLNSGGEWTIRVRIYHMKPPGNDGQAVAVATITIATFSVDVTTEPEGLNISVDGVTYTAPQSFTWLNGSEHAIGTFSPQLYGGASYEWVSWSDGGDMNHTVTATGNATYTAYFRSQYFLSVKTDPEGLAAIPGEGWYNKDTFVTLTAPDTVLVSTGVRYKFSHWDVDGESQGAGVNPITVTMDASHTATAHYVLQYYLSVTSLYDTPNPASGWFDAGTEITATVTSPWPVDAASTRYVCTGWAGTGSVPSSGTEASATFTITEPSSITWNWKTQYYMTFAQTGVGSDFTGAVMTVDSVDYDRGGYAAWYDAGVSVAFNYKSPLVVAVNQKQYVLTGVNASSPLTVSGSVTVTSSYTTQYYLTVVSEHGTTGGEGWYDSGATAYAEVSPLTVSGTAGARYVFSHWSGDASGATSPSNPVTMNAPKTAVASWKTEYLVTFDQAGLDGTAVGTVATIDGSAKTYGGLPFTMWVDSGASLSYSYETIVSSSTSGKRFRLDSVTGPASPVIVSGPATVTGNYKMQWLQTFEGAGLGSDATGMLVSVTIVGGEPSGSHTINVQGGSLWVDEGANITYAFANPVSSSVEGKQYRFDHATGPSSPYTVSGVCTVTGYCVVQWQVVFAVNPPGSGITDPSGVNWYDSGSQISILASANLGYSFSGWSVSTLFVTIADASSSSTTATINGQGTITAYFMPFYTISFTQTGLPPGTEWSMTFNGVTKFSTTSMIAFNVLSGDYSWSVLTPILGEPGTRYIASPASGTMSVPSQLSQTIAYSTQYRVAISWSGLGADADGRKVVEITVGGTIVNKNAGDSPYDEWVNSGTSFSYAYEEIVTITVSGKQYRLVSVSGTSTGFSHDFGPISGPVSETGSYKAQYYITVISAHGSPTASTWVDEASDFTASVTSPAETVLNDHQWICTGFSVDEELVQEGTGYTFANVQAPHTIVFYWKQQFWIQVNSDHDAPTPSQWVDQGGNLTVSVASPADESGGTRYRCTGYTLDGDQPVEDGSTSYTFTNVQSAHAITFNWITQYRVTFYTNLPSGTITVGGVIKNSGESEFYDEEASLTIVANAPADYGFSSWTVTGGVTVDDYSMRTTSMNVGGVGSLTANFVINTVLILVTSNPVTGVGIVRVDGASYATPVMFSWVIGSTHELEAVSTVPGPTGTRYVWTGWSDGGAQSHVYTVPGASETLTAYFSVQHYLTVVSPHDTPGGSGWYDEGAVAHATLETGTVVENSVQYVFAGWSGDASGTGLISNPITMNRPKTAVANWATELYTVTFDKSPRQGIITVDGTVYTSLPVVLQWAPGSSHEVVVPEIEESGGVRYVFRDWSDGSTLASRTITANTPGAVYIAYYNIQYRLLVHSEFGTTSGSGWYDDGAEVNVSVSPTVVRDETRGIEFTFKGWVGSGTGVYYTGPDNPTKVIMTGPVEEFAQWEPSMYYLKVVSEYGEPYGSGWYKPGSEAGFGVSTPVNHGNRTIRVFVNWSGDIDLREPAGTIIMVKPFTVVASWDTQYLVIYDTTAPNGVLLSIPRVPQTLPPGFNVFALYYSAGSNVEVGPAPETVYEGEETRYCFEGWAIDGKPVTPNANLTFRVDRPLKISVIYETELLLTVNVIGVSQPYTVKLTVASSPASIFDVTPASPFREWLRKGAGIALTVSSPNKIGHGEWAVFREWSGDAQASQRTVSLTVSTPMTVNAVFFAVNPVAESIPYSLLAGIISTVSSRFIRKRRGEEHEDRSRRSLALGIASLVVVLAMAAIVSSHVATGYGIDVREIPDFTNWAVVFTAIEAVGFLTMTIVVTRLAYPRRLEIPEIYPNPYGI